MIRVLFVCLGNICRSPMAEAVFAHMVQGAGLHGAIQADSAGCYAGHAGQPPHHGTRGILEQNGIPYCGTARMIVPDDLRTFDYVVTMDDKNLRYVTELASETPGARAHIAPLLEYAPIARKNKLREVPDPYYGGGFDGVYRLIQAGCIGLLEEIRARHEL